MHNLPGLYEKEPEDFQKLKKQLEQNSPQPTLETSIERATKFGNERKIAGEKSIEENTCFLSDLDYKLPKKLS